MRKTIEELNIGRLFSEIDAVTPLNFKEIFDLDLLDEEYLHAHSSLKPASRLAARYDENGVYDNLALALVIGNRYAYKWNAMWEGIKIKYDIIENYNMVEEETTDTKEDETKNDKETNTNTIKELNTVSETGTQNSSVKETTTTTNDLTDKETTAETITNGKVVTQKDVRDEKVNHGMTTNTDTSVYAFDNTGATPSTKENVVEGGTTGNTANNTLTSTNSGEDKRAGTNEVKKTGTVTGNNTNTVENKNTNSNNENKSRNEALERLANSTNKVIGNITRTLTRHGNIGVTTSSQMQEQYLRIVAEFYEFVNILYADLDSVLTLYIY